MLDRRGAHTIDISMAAEGELFFRRLISLVMTVWISRYEILERGEPCNIEFM